MTGKKSGKKNHSIIKTITMLAIFLMLTGIPGLLQAQETPAEKRAVEVFKLLNTGTRDQVRDYISTNFTPEFINKIPMSRHLQVVSETQDSFLKFEAKAFRNVSDYETQTVLYAPITETWFSFRITVEEKAPHKIITFRLTPGHSQPGEEETTKLTDQQIGQELEAYMKKLAAKEIFSGAVLVAKNDGVLFKQAYGVAMHRFHAANKTDTKFNLGSMNKMFTAVAVAQLVEKGKLSYDDPVSKYLDNTWISRETTEKVKVKHLLTHTSGLGSYFNKEFWQSSRMRFRTLEDFKPLVNGDKPRFEPGSNWGYSNTGMLLLGPIIEKASNKDYFHYVKLNIYDPADMPNSNCYEMDSPVPNLAMGYSKKYTDEGAFLRNNIFEHVIKGGPAGGGFSTVEDLFNFTKALRNNSLITKASLDLLTTPKHDLNSPVYGYGFQVTEVNGERIVGHSGGFSGIRSTMRMYINSGYTYVILSNFSNGGMTAVKSKIESLISRAGG